MQNVSRLVTKLVIFTPPPFENATWAYQLHYLAPSQLKQPGVTQVPRSTK